MSSSRPPPPKPWERKGTTSEPIAVSTSVANGANLSKTPIPDPSTNSPTPISPRTPPSRMTSPNMSMTPPYDRFGSAYSNHLPYYGGGSAYSSLNGVGSRYGGLGYGSYGSSLASRYGSTYGSSYGGYGNRYGGYSSFGGYGSLGSYGPYNRFGMNDLPPRDGNLFQNALDTGYGKLRGFGDMVEGFSRFSQLLDANFDAIHGSFASVIRLIDVFGEFAYMTRSFWLIRAFLSIISKFWRTFAWLLGRDASRQSSSPHEFIGDYVKHEREQKRKKVLLILLFCVGTILSAPVFLIRFLKIFKNSEALAQLENIWREPFLQPVPEFRLVRALHDFQGSNEMDLSFRKNDMIKLLGTPYPDWWEGEIDGRRGFFPAQFVHLEGEAPRVAEFQDPENLPS